MIISISGKINSGKDTVAAIIQYLIWKNKVEKGEKIAEINYNDKRNIEDSRNMIQDAYMVTDMNVEKTRTILEIIE